jgi:hypothetical protein
MFDIFNFFKKKVIKPLKNILYNNSQKALYIIPFIYANFITKVNYIKYSINALYLVNFCNNYDIYLLNTLDVILNVKIKCVELIRYLSSDNKDFVLLKTELYNDLYSYQDVTKEFLSIIKDRVDRKVIIDLYSFINKEIVFNDDIRLKIYFRYKSIEYIQYFPYNNESYIPYPLYSEDIIKNYRNDYVYPNFINENINNGIFYSIFSMESKDIDSIIINDTIFNKDTELYKYFKKIQTPFNDLGILYQCQVKLLWVLVENSIDLNTFKNFELKYLNMYFDEEKMDLLEHKITFNTNDYTSYKYIIINLKDISTKKTDDVIDDVKDDIKDDINEITSESNKSEISEEGFLEKQFLISDRMKVVMKTKYNVVFECQ